MSNKSLVHKLGRNALLALFLWLALTSLALAKSQSLQTQANVMVEFTFTAATDHIDPFNEVTMDAIFRDPKGKELRVPAFWDGSNVWKVRYASPILGKHKFRTVSSDVHDRGLDGITGQVIVKPYTGQNPLYIHGPVRMAADHRHLEHIDGTPFFWLGDTWWMGLAKRLHWPDDVKTLAEDRKAKGFTVIQLVAGLYPDMYPFDPRGANEAGFPWETNYTSIRPEYFDAADQRFEYLADQGIAPCIVGAWGYFLPWMGVDKAKAHWRYLVARYGALPVFWCVAGEANLNWYRAKPFPVDDREQIKGWTEVARSLRATDPYHRLITIHPTGIGRLSSRHAMDDLSLIDIDMLQTPHGQADAVAPTVNTVRQSYNDTPVLPVIDGEAAYEMLGDNLPTQWTRQMFWLCMMNGAAGHTYGANGIWQNNRRNDPHGASPPDGSPPTGYGKIAWDEAMSLPGSQQEGFGKKLLLQYDWSHFTPHPEWAEFPTKRELSLEAAKWIWFPEGEPAKNAPAAKRYFRRNFVLPEGVVITAKLRMTADDRFEVHLNGKSLGGSSDWNQPRQFDNLVAILKPGTNIIAVMAENMPANFANPAGLIGALEIQSADGNSLKLITDAAWLCATNETAGWDQPDFDDSSWTNALVETAYGGAPWGNLGTQKTDAAFGPQSAGIPDVIRMTYVPKSDAVTERGLKPQTDYRASYFDPVTGAQTDGGLIHADNAGLFSCPPPVGVDHDWVLILEAKH